ncbi:hypothetical protein D9757_005091 [Collybiopsis confluens]|uniref:Uncharacterized protein n=1 Tax=Collybiopsis confluens TaxID=2823264 RepID=A0A8H5HTM7_9AGAR|nr:hypothetical protein D9757_005091 [Collybiopsis confluens]
MGQKLRRVDRSWNILFSEHPKHSSALLLTADFVGFFVDYNNDEPSFVGLTKTNLKHFPIDGPGRSSGLGVWFDPSGPQGCQGIFGMLRESSVREIQNFPPPGEDYGIAGLYGSFEIKRNYPRFIAFGAFALSSTRAPTTAKLIFLPYRRRGAFPATYLDLTKPVSKIWGLIAAPDGIDIAELGGFAITHADGSCFVGVPTDLWLAVEDNREGGTAYWDLGPEHGMISMITAWSGRYLNGIQFDLVDGRSSTCWGKVGGKALVVILTKDSFASDLGSEGVAVQVGAVGIKVYLDSQREHLNASDARLGCKRSVVSAQDE